MTTTTDPAHPPVYKRKELPEHLAHLRTATELKAQRLKPAEGQEPVALVRVYRRGHGWGEFPLYDPAGAAPMRALSPEQQAAWTARRTCPKCQTVRDHVVQYGTCGPCLERERQEAEDRRARTCHWCRRESGAALPLDHGWRACPHCRVRHTLRRQFEEERAAAWRRTCPGRDCLVATATDEEIAAERAAGTWRGPRWCPPCAERDERERAEQQRAAEEERARAAEERRLEVAGLEEWARKALVDPDVVVLDTETTGLHPEARIVDLGVVSAAGEILVDTLLAPGEPIPAEASDVHGLTDADVRGAPAFGDVVEQLGAAVAGKRVLIYNRGYDVARLRHELQLHYQQTGHPDPAAAADQWLAGARWEDAMIPYSTWVGEWSDCWGGYAWQRLWGGDHRAVSDCRAVLDRLRDMAAGANVGV